MRKKLSAFLVAFVACLGLALAGGVYLTTSREMAAAIARIKQGTAAALLENFRYFDLLLWQAERGFDQHLEEALPALARRILDGERPLAAYSAQELKELAQAEGLDDLYLLDAEGEVVASSFPPDLGLNLREASETLRLQLGEVAGAGRVLIERASVAIRTGQLRKYAYFSPVGRREIVEASLDLAPALARATSPEYRDLILGGLFAQIVVSNPYVTRLDIFKFNRLGAWSIIHPGQPMDPRAAARINQEEAFELHEGGRHLVYTRLHLDDFRPSQLSSRVCALVAYDFSRLEGYPWQLTRAVLMILLGLAVPAYWLLHRFLNRHLVARILAISRGVAGLARGEKEGVPVRGDDELALIAGQINRMHEEARRREESLRRAGNELAREVEERRQAEASLAASQERYRNLVDNLPYGVFEVELPSGRMLYGNRTILELTGYGPEDVPGLCFWNMHSPESIAEIRRRIQERMAGAPVALGPQRYTTLHKDGTPLRCEVAVSFLRLEGKTVMQGLLRDVSQQESLERQLQQAQKMEAVGTLASGIAHDFNNVLHAIGGYVQLLRQEPGLSPKGRRQLGHITQAARMAGELIQRLLAFGRKVEPRLRPMDLNQAVTSCLAILERTLPRMIELRTRLAGDLKGVEGDPTLLEQVILNLAANARDAMPEGGTLTVTTGNHHAPEGVEPGALPPGDYVRLTVTDSGHGMDQATLARIFEPFFTTKEAGKGSGLGLPMVYGIVQGHRGHIACQSRPGEGARFMIHLPALRESAPPGELLPEEAPAPAGRGEVVLLVDDEPSVLDLGREALTGAGYRVITARTGEEALEVAARPEAEVGLAILDLGMPGMGGRRALLELNRRHPGIRLMVVSGYALSAPERAELTPPALAILGKPLSLHDLLCKVREALDG